MLLAAAGGTIALARPGRFYIDRIVYGAQAVDISGAREPDGSNKWVIEWHVSPGAANPAGDGQPVAPEQAGDAPEMVPAAGDLSDQVLGYDLMPAFELQISDDGIASLRASPATWVPATLIYLGRSYGPVAVNLKGTSSFQPIDGKPAFRVNIDKMVKGARFFGLKEFLLNNMTTDGSMMHERLAYWVARQAGGGLPASRCNHAQLTMNGQPLGLYAIVEEPKRAAHGAVLHRRHRPVYTIHYADFVPSYLSSFQLDDGAGRSDAGHRVSRTRWRCSRPRPPRRRPRQYVNWHLFNRYWAVMVITGHWGGWPYAPDPEPAGANAGLYADPTSKQLYFIPEGINDAFSTGAFDFIKQAKSVLAQDLPRDAVVLPGLRRARSGQILDQLDQLGLGVRARSRGGADRAARRRWTPASPTATPTWPCTNNRCVTSSPAAGRTSGPSSRRPPHEAPNDRPLLAVDEFLHSVSAGSFGLSLRRHADSIGTRRSLPIPLPGPPEDRLRCPGGAKIKRDTDTLAKANLVCSSPRRNCTGHLCVGGSMAIERLAIDGICEAKTYSNRGAPRARTRGRAIGSAS